MRPKKIHSRIPCSQVQRIIYLPFILLAVSLACSLPAVRRSTPVAVSPTASALAPTFTAEPQPPALVESQPPRGSSLPLSAPITLFFNQAMDRASVESAIRGEPILSGRFSWKDDATLSFIPDVPFLPNTSVTLTIATSAQSRQGLTLQEPILITFKTAGYMRLTQALPEPGSSEVDVSSAITAAFNYPVIPIGMDPTDAPQAFSIDPPVRGHGEWTNTSTYIFKAEPALAGSQTYTIRLNPDLRGTDGNPLEAAGDWSFTTGSPGLLSIVPAHGEKDVSLDAEIVLTFNQPMNPQSAGNRFSVRSSDGESIPGQISWNDNLTTLVFTPTGLLPRNANITVFLEAGSQTYGGTPLGEPIQSTWSTLPELSITGSNPSQDGVTGIYSGVTLSLTSIISEQVALDFITLQPQAANLRAVVPQGERKLQLVGDFEPETAYTLSVSAGLTDLWGSTLSEAYRLEFRTAPLEPSFLLTNLSSVIFLTTDDTSIAAQATNIGSIDLSIGSVPLQDLIAMLGPAGYEKQRTYIPADARPWRQPLDVLPNRSQPVELSISPNGRGLAPGVYMLNIPTPLPGSWLPPLLVVSDYQTTFKLSTTEALVWVTDLRQNIPADEVPIAIYDEEGTLLASGTTGEEGVFMGQIPIQENPYLAAYAVVGNPGDEYFSMAASGWDLGITPNNFDLPANYAPAGIKAYLYTDKPIYRPGQTVYFRAIVRDATNEGYKLPDMETYPLVLFGHLGQELASFDLPISAFGTVHGQYELLPDAQAGYYRLGEGSDSIWFQVAEYRKPEIDLRVSFSQNEILAGEALVANLEARYFFDAPASNTPIRWALYAADAEFSLPGYQVGAYDAHWLEGPDDGLDLNPLGKLVQEGEGRTGEDGKLTLELPGEASDKRQKLTLEVTIQDESSFPTSARASILVNPARLFIAVRPDSWIAQAGQAVELDVRLVDWDGDPSRAHDLRARLLRVAWDREDPVADRRAVFPKFVPSYTLIEEQSTSSGEDGSTRLSFVPPDPGTYQVEISGEGALTQVLVWVSGAGQAVWPDLPNQQIRLIADQDEYLPGDTAWVFVPNPFEQQALALLTIEGRTILEHEVLEIEPGGSTIPLSLVEEHAPNIYISVTLLGRTGEGQPDFRVGYARLLVKSVEQTLNVSLTSMPERSSPGEPVTFSLRVTDAEGEPVQGEFSLAVVDSAALALAEPNTPGILEGLYGEQPIGVRTALSLAVYGGRHISFPGGLGGSGGMEDLSRVAREEFPDTAHWDAEIVTDVNGEAQVTITLPDSLTTWQVDARGITADTRVGEKKLQLAASKELLLRPVAPRFVVAGDQVLLAAIVHNNTNGELLAEINLESEGLAIENPDEASQELALPAGGRARVEWWATALDMPVANLVFSVQGTDPSSGATYQDAVRLASGALPVLRYTAPQTFATSGVLQEEDRRLELISLPVSYEVEGGRLTVGLSTSLAAAMLDALEALESYPYECNEQTLSRFLPNLVASRTMQSFGFELRDLQERMERTLKSGLNTLMARQNPDGGWGWWPGGESDVTTSSYILFGLSRAREAGISISEQSIQRAVEYLYSVLITPSMAGQNWQLDRLAFQHFALSQAGAGDLAGANALFEARDRLSAWAQALLALTLESTSLANPQTQLLLSDLQAKAIRTGTGVHWESLGSAWQNMDSPNTSTAIVVYALSQLEPASRLLPDAVRYLMSNRQAEGGWASTYESAWVILANSAYMRGTGELSGDFTFETTLNGSPLVSGGEAPDARLTPVNASVLVEDLQTQEPNALVIERAPGPGRLYYTAALKVYSPAETIAPLDRGISLSRRYETPGGDCSQVDCAGLESARVGEHLRVRLTLILPNDAYNLLVEDYIPAGSEILEASLKTSQQGTADEQAQLYDPEQPFGEGWGWWLFHAAQNFDDHIAWAADYLPAGTYELTYTLSILQPGEYKVLPARAWQFYFPEVQGSSAGASFTIYP